MNRSRRAVVAGALRYVEANVRAHADFAGFLAAVGSERLNEQRRRARELMPR